MIETPKSLRQVAIGQFAFATLFIFWLFFLPLGGATFAWPVVPRATSIFLGASFILRAYLGVRIRREGTWFRLRWVVWGNYVFLAIILTATFWHVEQMNWKISIILAHVWIVIYVLEPFLLPFLGPFGAEKDAPVPEEYSQGPLLRGMKYTLILIVMVGAALGGLLFINPEFMNTRWPWPLDPFNARILAAWPAAIAAWAATVALMKDWAEIKMGVQSIVLYGVCIFVAWLILLPGLDKSRENVYAIGLIAVILGAPLIYFYWRQERNRRAA